MRSRSFLAVVLLIWHGVAATTAVAQTTEFSARIEATKASMLDDPRKAFELSRSIESDATRLPAGAAKSRVLAQARWIGGEALVRVGRAPIARPLVENAVGIARRSDDPRLLADVLLTRGAIQSELVQVAAALGTYQQAYRAFVQARYPRGQAIALQNVANLYVNGGDHVTAERYYRQSEEAYSGDPILSLTLYNNRALSLWRMDRHGESLAQYRRALAIAEAQRSPVFAASILANMARVYLDRNRVAEGEVAIGRAQAIVNDVRSESVRSQIDSIAALAAFKRGNLDRAVDLAERSFKGVDLETTRLNHRDAHVIAYDIYLATGDKDRALAHLQALRRLTDEATRLAASTNTALMAARFDFANQELAIARLKAQELQASIALERSRAQYQRTLFLSAGAATLLILGLLSFGLFTIRRSRNEVRAANTELAATNIQLEKALAAKTEFLATTSHEIRTPLNGILGMTQVMLADRALPTAHRDRIEVVHGAGLAMRSLVDDILDVAKMETGNLEVTLEPTDLRALLAAIARMWTEQARAKGLAFEAECEAAPHWVETDAGRLRQMVSNLLSNALKFTAEGSIGLSARASEDGQALVLAVRDTGIGIAPDKHGAIFESFRQADSTTTREFGGTGLGLTICRRLAEALGGTIAVASDSGQGSTFTVTLPLRPATAPASEAPCDCGAGGLLIVDANPISRAMLRTLLAPRVARVVLADTASAAVAAIAAEGTHCVLVDESALARDDRDAALAELERLAAAAGTSGASVAVLWRAPDEAISARVRALGVLLVAKPIAGAALAATLFDEGAWGNSSRALVSRAA